MSKKKKNAQLTESEAIRVLRLFRLQFLRIPGLTSCGVGFRQKSGKRTNDVCIQVSVARKLSDGELQTQGVAPIPTSVADPESGRVVPVDVVERTYQPAFDLDDSEDERPDFRSRRRSRLDPIAPGASVANFARRAGTIGAIVFDLETNEPLILSNWHILCAPNGESDEIAQPGPRDDSDASSNKIGQLRRSHLGLAGDCAVASIAERGYERTIIELNMTPQRTAKPNLRDKVVKSGRTTGVTFGIVERVDVSAPVEYGETRETVGAFEIRVNPAKRPLNGEISDTGDSGALWMVDGDRDVSDIALGLHFAGETTPGPAAEHALACPITCVARKLKFSLRPRNT